MKKIALLPDKVGTKLVLDIGASMHTSLVLISTLLLTLLAFIMSYYLPSSTKKSDLDSLRNDSRRVVNTPTVEVSHS